MDSFRERSNITRTASVMSSGKSEQWSLTYANNKTDLRGSVSREGILAFKQTK